MPRKGSETPSSSSMRESIAAGATAAREPGATVVYTGQPNEQTPYGGALVDSRFPNVSTDRDPIGNGNWMHRPIPTIEEMERVVKQYDRSLRPEIKSLPKISFDISPARGSTRNKI